MCTLTQRTQNKFGWKGHDGGRKSVRRQEKKKYTFCQKNRI